MVLGVACLLLPFSAWSRDISLDIRPGDGVTDQRKLSDYFAPLKDTNLDTDVFILDSGKPGATALLIGGTHGNELAGSVAALVALENSVVTAGQTDRYPLYQPQCAIDGGYAATRSGNGI